MTRQRRIAVRAHHPIIKRDLLLYHRTSRRGIRTTRENVQQKQKRQFVSGRKFFTPGSMLHLRGNPYLLDCLLFWPKLCSSCGPSLLFQDTIEKQEKKRKNTQPRGDDLLFPTSSCFYYTPMRSVSIFRSYVN
ncbi:GQ67_01799T0 [Komagataella phaffii]|nr:GQ67_01799T0 [Komagataella phaffii]AOA65427.1 GQ68_01814T0 [Komagataella phaffii GS115]